MTPRGADRREDGLRLAISVAGLCLLLAAVVLRWGQWGPATVEALAIGGIFFGGSALWSLHALLRHR